MREWFVKTRRDQGYSQKSLAIAVGCSPAQINKVDHGCAISVRTAKRIAAVLDLDWTKFFDE